jgi:hypothetical protein
MLQLTVLGDEYFDEEKSEFIVVGGFNLELEHSLVSLSKWEQIYEKPFLTEEEKTPEEIFDYFKAMAVHSFVPDYVFDSLTADQHKKIMEYISKKATATWFNERPGTRRSSEVITSELIYYWMSACNVPIECENWHLNRLLTVIRIHALKQEKPKPMSLSERIAQQKAINEKRRAELEARIQKGENE